METETPTNNTITVSFQMPIGFSLVKIKTKHECCVITASQLLKIYLMALEIRKHVKESPDIHI